MAQISLAPEGVALGFLLVLALPSGSRDYLQGLGALTSLNTHTHTALLQAGWFQFL